MKNLIARILTPLSLATLWLAGAAHAQYVQRTIKVNVPFEFTIGDKGFRAGDYFFVTTNPNQLSLHDSQGHVVASLLTHSVESLEASPSTKLRFSTLDGGHALRQIWIVNQRVGFELAPTKPAALLAKQRSHAPAESTGAGNK